MRFTVTWLGLCVVLGLTQAASAAGVAPARPPHIVYILADDLGYGDVRCFNPKGKIATPRIDQLAAGGMRFTDAHSGSAVCTPTRYGILTGRYAWRSSLKSGVLDGYSKRLIEPGRLTVPEFLRQNGYRTFCVGKWHLGMDWQRKAGSPAGKITTGWEIDYARPIANGPLAVGFDDYFGISASLDMPPFVFIKRDRSQSTPTVEKTWLRKGPAGADFEAVDVLPALVRSATSLIESNAEAARAGKPFFLYVPLSAPHTPILPTSEWRGKSGLNDYGDFVMQVDRAVGQILDSLETNGLANETMVIFTSDNGCSPSAGYPALLAKGHDPSAGFRGTKADIFEGGHRVPFIVRWPGKVRPGSTCEQVICLNDLFATSAAILGARLPDSAAEDSVSMLPALLGTAAGPLREAIVHHSINGSFAIRQGPWKLALCPDSGGWSSPRPGRDEVKGLPEVQLYNLSMDRVERDNVQGDHPEIVDRLTRLLEKYVADGRSTPGIPRPNNGAPVEIRRAVRTARAGDARKPVKVFILAGQSNMEGQAVVDLAGKDYNGGKGTLVDLLKKPAKAGLVKHLKTPGASWKVRDDVWVWYQREDRPLLTGPLGLGFSVYGDTHHFGPELQFGHVVGDHFPNPVLLIKTAWGGKSLYKDFRPPSSGGAVGPYYTKMLAQVRLALANLATIVPGDHNQGYELAGFVWYQGWNDGVEPRTAVPEYEQNLVNLIKDLRKDLKAPNLPVVVGELTGPWVEAPGEWAALRRAQAAAAARPEFKGSVRFVATHDFVRPADESPNPGHGHHEFGNAETYLLVGNALGQAMVALCPGQPGG